jgi:hypothetical protein
MGDCPVVSHVIYGWRWEADYPRPGDCGSVEAPCSWVVGRPTNIGGVVTEQKVFGNLTSWGESLDSLT